MEMELPEEYRLRVGSDISNPTGANATTNKGLQEAQA
jgi:hypothetical protein